MRCVGKKIENNLIRKAIVFAIVSLISSFAWGTAYYWKGSDTSWNNTANWYASNDPNAPTVGSYPNGSDAEVYINFHEGKSVLVELQNDIVVKKCVIGEGQKLDVKRYKLTVDSTNNFECHGTFAFDASNISPVNVESLSNPSIYYFRDCWKSTSLIEVNIPEGSTEEEEEFSNTFVYSGPLESDIIENIRINLPGKIFKPKENFRVKNIIINCKQIETDPSYEQRYSGEMELQSDAIIKVNIQAGYEFSKIWFLNTSSINENASSTENHSLTFKDRVLISGTAGDVRPIGNLIFEGECIFGNVGSATSENDDIKITVAGTQTFKNKTIFRTVKCTFAGTNLVMQNVFERYNGINSAIIFDTPVTLENDIKINVKKVTFKKPVTGASKNLTIDCDTITDGSPVTFENTVGTNEAPLGNLLVQNSNVVVFGNDVHAKSIVTEFPGTQPGSSASISVTAKKSIKAHNGNINFSYYKLDLGENSALTLSASSDIIFNTLSSKDDGINLLSGPVTLSAGNSITAGGGVQPGKINGAQKLILETTGSSEGTIVFNGPLGRDIPLGSSFDEKALIINGRNTCIFTGDVKINGVIEQHNNVVVFKRNFEQLTSGTTGNVFAGNVKFETGNANTSLKAAQDITFGDEDADTFILAATDSSTLTIDTSASGKNVIFNSVIDAEISRMQSLTVNAGTGNINVNVSTSSSKYANAMKLAAKNILLKENIALYAGSMEVTNSGLYLQKSGARVVSNGVFTQTASGDTSLVQLEGEIQTTQNVSFGSDVYLKSGAKIPAGNNTISFAKNVYAAATGESTMELISSAKTATAINVGKSFILCSGTLNLNGNLSVAEDLILLGKDNADSYSDKDSATGTADLFSYFNANRTVAGKVTALPSTYADGSEFPNLSSNWKGSLVAANLGGKKITVGANLYDNGVNLNPDSAWTLSIPANDVDENYFAEVYNAKIKNSNVEVNAAVTAEGTFAKVAAAEGCTDEGGNTNGDGNKLVGWDFTGLGIKEAYTINDDILCIVFNQPVENSKGELSAAFGNIKYNGGTKAFAGIYSDAECTMELGTDSDVTTVYLKTNDGAENRWNTDATGSSAGTAQSTDRGRADCVPNHSSVIPDIDICKTAAGFVYATLRDDAKNRIVLMSGDGNRFTATKDNCSPVLTAVYTGQELHSNYNSSTGASSQMEYDAHNFIEFQYSEPVKIGNLLEDSVNVRAEESFERADSHGGAITNNESGITVAGFAVIASGKVVAGERTDSATTVTGAESTTVHSLYRKFKLNAASDTTVQSNRVRISIAGFVDGSVEVNGNSYNNWRGYISEAVTPSGEVTRIANSFIKDVAGNILDAGSEEETVHTLPSITVNANDVTAGLDMSADVTLYGSWDNSSPKFALWLKNGDWSSGATSYNNENGDVEFEIIASTGSASGTQLDRIEFHVFDNTPAYLEEDEYFWISKFGWYAKGTDPSIADAVEFAADISGGSRARGGTNRTGGGLRRSSLIHSYTAFTYRTEVESQMKNFKQTEPVQTTVNSLFSYTENPDKKTNAPSDDSLYFALFLTDADKNLPVTTTFKLEFNSQNCFMTDLAGNLLKGPSSRKLSTLNRTAPQFALSLAAVGKNEMIILFSKKLNSSLLQNLNTIKDSLEFITIGAENRTKDISEAAHSDLNFDSRNPEQIFADASISCIKFFLNRNITLNDIKTTWVRVKKPVEQIIDSQTGLASLVSPIKDEDDNSMNYYSVHALSDFAINSVLPLNAYSNTETGLADADNITFNTIFNFDRTESLDNRLSSNSEICLQANIANSRSEDLSVAETTEDKAVVYFDSDVTAPCSDQYNYQTKASADVWLPIALPSFNSEANVPDNAEGMLPVSQEENGILNYVIPKGFFTWKSGNSVQFLFAITDSNGKLVTIDNDGESSSDSIPLYSLRLMNESDLTSFDLWQFGLLSSKLQRGKVTILNNVINVGKQEATTVQVDSGKTKLKIAVMTIDGNVVKYLENGNVESGTYYYRWDGKNNAGNYVARGLYFIRVIGENIDETRKVIVVK